MTLDQLEHIRALTGAQVHQAFQSLPRPEATIEVSYSIVDTIGNSSQIYNLHEHLIGEEVAGIIPCLNGDNRPWRIQTRAWGNSKPNDLLDYQLVLVTDGNKVIMPGELEVDTLVGYLRNDMNRFEEAQSLAARYNAMELPALFR